MMLLETQETLLTSSSTSFEAVMKHNSEMSEDVRPHRGLFVLCSENHMTDASLSVQPLVLFCVVGISITLAQSAWSNC